MALKNKLASLVPSRVRDDTGRSGRDARAWRTFQSQGVGENAATRDYHNTQQLERSEIEPMRSYVWAEMAAALIGVVVTIGAWIVWGLLGFTLGLVMSVGGGHSAADEAAHAAELGVKPYYIETKQRTGGVTEKCYQPVDKAGVPERKCFRSVDKIERPQWHIDATKDAMIAHGENPEGDDAGESSLSSWLLFGHAGMLRTVVSFGIGFGVFALMRVLLRRQTDTQNLTRDTTDISQHTDDQHIALPGEVLRTYSFFPDAGATSPVQPNSLISHAMLLNKGLKTVEVPKRATEDILDSDGDILTYKGDVLRDEEGELIYETKPIIDHEFGEDLFTMSGIPQGKEGAELRRRFDARGIPDNPGGKNIERFGSHETMAEHINAEWEMPDYEPQRPAGVYIVDEAPVNTMVLAITRAGKGQTYIEPLIDMWLRETTPNNMVVNDPKGELLVKHYVRACFRGYEVVQFNLMNALKTDIYNPLALAAEAAREGDITKCSMYVGNIAEVFFPADSGDDPVWPNAASNAFKRTAFGLIDFYLDEERRMRKQAIADNWDVKVLDTKLDVMWGRVTLYNCYQFFVRLSAKKLKDPVARLKQRQESGEFGDVENDEDAKELYEELKLAAENERELWNGEPELDMLTLFFNATDKLPNNSIRGLVSDADKSLRAMATAEKMLASVYGIAITGMNFFTIPTISTLTSGTLSQSVDLAGMSFPRRIGVRFNQNFVRRNNLVGVSTKWDAFSDPGFTQELGSDFTHSEVIDRGGWARFMFKGIFPENTAYIRLRLFNQQSGTQIKSFYFKFVKSWQTNLKGRSYIVNQITGEKIVRNGVLTELVKTTDADGAEVFKPGSMQFAQDRLNIDTLSKDELRGDVDSGVIKPVKSKTNAILQTSVRYSEQPKAVFLVTPPHLMEYAKLILILIKQLVDLNFDQSYMTKENQKPLYKTRFMLDELGNLQNDGHGIAGFETMLSIGLGQEQQFTLILQTMEQLRAVYGDSVDSIVQGNAQPLDAKIATPTGWKLMGEMEAGTQVLTPSGEVTQVSGVYPRGTRPVYEVVRADGSTTTACNEHLWEVEIED